MHLPKAPRLLDRLNWILPQIPVRTYRRLPLYRALRPRRFRLYHVGMGKTGTHSIAAVFKRHHLSAHEAEARGTIHLIGRLRAGATTEEIDASLIARDERLYLEVESSHLLNEFTPNLVRLFPEAKFLICLRDPWSWLRSNLSQAARTQWMPEDSPWRLHRRLTEGLIATAPEEAYLAAHRMSSIGGILSHFATMQRRLLEIIPENRRLIIRVQEIGNRLPEIAALAGVRPETLQREASHKYKSIIERSPLDELDVEYVDALVEKHCGDFAREWFPEAKTLAEQRRQRG